MFGVDRLNLMCTLIILGYAEQLNDFKPQNLLSSEKSIKIPGVIQRMYRDWAAKPKYEARKVQSIPVQVTHLEDQTLLMTSPFPSSKNTIVRKAELLMEFHDVKHPNKLRQLEYSIDIKPAEVAYDCFMHSRKKPQFRDRLLEIIFNITSLYVGCRNKDSKYIQLKVILKPQTTEDPGKELTTYSMDAFIILQEVLRNEPEIVLNVTGTELSEETFKQLGGITFKRSKRLTDERRKKTRSKRFCGLRKWYVKFDDMGWSWVIAPPKGFLANRCYGRCSFPLTAFMNTTNHAVVQTLMNSMYGKPKPSCCVAKDMSPLTMLFLEDNGIITMKKYPDMIITSCACL